MEHPAQSPLSWGSSLCGFYQFVSWKHYPFFLLIRCYAKCLHKPLYPYHWIFLSFHIFLKLRLRIIDTVRVIQYKDNPRLTYFSFPIISAASMWLLIEGLLSSAWVLQDGQCGPVKHEFTIICTAVGFFLPLLIMLVMYALSVKALKAEAAAVSAMMPPIRNHASHACRPASAQYEIVDKPGKDSIDWKVGSLFVPHLE